jgi:hypothetical protein
MENRATSRVTVPTEGTLIMMGAGNMQIGQEETRGEPRSSEWRPSNNEETNKRCGQTPGRDRGPAEEGGRWCIH